MKFNCWYDNQKYISCIYEEQELLDISRSPFNNLRSIIYSSLVQIQAGKIGIISVKEIPMSVIHSKRDLFPRISSSAVGFSTNKGLGTGLSTRCFFTQFSMPKLSGSKAAAISTRISISPMGLSLVQLLI